MTQRGAQSVLTGFLLGVTWLAAACGGTANHPREEPSATGGTGATGAIGATGGMPTGGAGMSASGTGGATAGTPGACLGVGENALIVDFDEGAMLVERNYPILSGAMPGGTYAYADPTDTTVVFTAAMVPAGHTCQALGLGVTGSSWRGIGLWSTVAVDATVYTGVLFWAKRGAGVTEPSTAKVALGMDAVTMSGTGTGTCAGTTGCVRPEAAITLTDTWTEYALHWADFTPGSADGVAVPASGTQVNGLDLAFTTTLGAPTVAGVDLDDIAFLK